MKNLCNYQKIFLIKTRFVKNLNPHPKLRTLTRKRYKTCVSRNCIIPEKLNTLASSFTHTLEFKTPTFLGSALALETLNRIDIFRGRAGLESLAYMHACSLSQTFFFFLQNTCRISTTEKK